MAKKAEPPEDRRYKFITILAEYLAGTNQAEMSIKLQTGHPEALRWRKMRAASPLFGYPSVEEAAVQLDSFLRGGA